ncbi:MAG TPA: O-antigen ligase family protein [candidate division Zixibacteria bacterium]|nr:O-antigen ligase family protein [candidate division Zixibacteria bacterium]
MPSSRNLIAVPLWPASDNARHCLWGVLLLSPLVLIVGDFLPMAACAYIGGLLLVFLLVNPRYSYALHLFAISIYAAVQVGPFAVLPSDALFMVSFIAVILDYLLRGETEIDRTSFDFPLLSLMFFTYLSILGARSFSMSLTPAVRILTIYMAFRVGYRISVQVGPRRVLLWYLGLVTVLAAINCVEFVRFAGQKRIWGIAWLSFEAMSMTALPMAATWMVWSDSARQKIYSGLACFIIGLGIFATQSRAPMLAVAIAVPVLLFVAIRKERLEGPGRGIVRTVKMLVPLVAVIGIFTIYQQSLFAGALGRVKEFVNSLTIDPEGTVALRIVLWTTAIKAFIAHPLMGIGIGNFRIVDQVITEVRMNPVWYYIRGMSTHNVILQYLAETGIFGGASLLWLAWRGMSRSYRDFFRASGRDSIQLSAALFIGLFVYAVTILYMRSWTWGQDGYIMAMLFGLSAAWHKRSSSTESFT